MDCNNYSYSKMNAKSNEIAAFYGNDSIVFIEYIVNYFQDKYYIVYDILTGYFDEFKTYTEAARAYNSIVSDDHIIPLF